MKRAILLNLFPVLLPIALAQQPGTARVFKAGAATSNITPPLGSPIVGGWTSPPATYIHDELHARCLVLDDGATRIAFAVADSVGVARDVLDAAKRSIHSRTGLPVERILMSATHTHSASSSRGSNNIAGGEPLDEYQRFLASRLADCVLCAINNLEPARIGWGSGSEPGQVHNRRWRMKPGFPLNNPFGGTDLVRMNPPAGSPNLLEPAGPTDPEIAFISVQSVRGRPIALLANYSLHYVGGVPSGHISADYFAMFAGRIAELLGAGSQNPPFVGIMTNGTSGNINNINFRVPRPPRKPYEQMRVVANLVAAEVFKAYQTMEHRDWVQLGSVQREIPIGVRVPTAAQVERAQAILRRPKDAPKAHVHEDIYAQRIIQMSTFPPRIPVILQTLRIGDVGIAAIPFEVFVEIGLEIKKKTPLPRSFTISLANGTYGYLPTVEHHKLGGYETWLGTNRVEIEAAPKIVAAVLEMLGELK